MVQYELVLRSVYYEYRLRCTMRLVVLAGRGYAWRPQLFAAMRACMAGRRGGAAEAPSRSCCRDAEVAAV
jgi:hypothetical protein